MRPSPTPIASIIVPSFNHDRFVGAAIESALDQTFRDFEIIVVDDGSTDASVERLERFETEPRFRLIRQENCGAHAAIERGLEASRGEFLFLLNSDDRFIPTRLERLVEALEARPGAAAATSWLRVIDEDDSLLAVKQGWSNLPPWPQPVAGPSLNDLGRSDLALLQGNYISTTTNLAIRRSLLPRAELLPLRYCHDWNFALALARRGEIVVVESALADYRVHPKNTLREGAEVAESRGRMRFEILWVVARHAPALLTRAVAAGLDSSDLRDRFARSAPRFERTDILSSLLSVAELAGDRALLDLLDEAHTWRRAAVEALAVAEPA